MQPEINRLSAMPNSSPPKRAKMRAMGWSILRQLDKHDLVKQAIDKATTTSTSTFASNAEGVTALMEKEQTLSKQMNEAGASAGSGNSGGASAQSLYNWQLHKCSCVWWKVSKPFNAIIRGRPR